MNEVLTKKNLDELEKLGVILETGKLVKHEHQGWMSTVYITQSNIGQLIVRFTKPVGEHKRNKVWDKFSGLAMIQKEHPEISTPEIIYVDYMDGVFILIQKLLVGTPAGKRVFDGNTFTDVWSEDRVLIKQIFKALAHVHSVQLKDFGWPIFENNELRGTSSSWKDFLVKEFILWLDKIKEADKKLNKDDLPADRIEEFKDKTFKQIDYEGPAVLVHGDAINPSNVLVDNGRINLLDWEWSISADPAWEFCDLGWWPHLNQNEFAPYFDSIGLAGGPGRDGFLQRVNLYIPLWLMWGTYMHANDSNPDVYLGLRKLFIERI